MDLKGSVDEKENEPLGPRSNCSELKDKARQKHKVKDIKAKIEKVSLVLGIDIGMESVEFLSSLALVGKFMF